MHKVSVLHVLRIATLLQSPAVHAFQPCPLLGPDFPAPTALLGSSTIHKALTNLTQMIDHNVATGNGTHGPTTPNATSFSLSVFSTAENSADADGTLFQYHHTAPPLLASPQGVHAVDQSSIYRIGDMTMVFTVWLFLIEAGDAHWGQPVTKYIPELRTTTRNHDLTADSIATTQWDDVLVGDLASHLAGIGQNYDLEDIARSVLSNEIGLPQFNGADEPTCNLTIPCDREEFLAGLTRKPPVFLPGTTPVYSDASFQLLGYLLEDITGKSFETMMNTAIFRPLDMTSTSISRPNTSKAVIPDGENASGWLYELGDGAAWGSIYSTLSDMTKAGKAILASSLIKPAMTRRWLKPVSLTSNVRNQVGRPWEIYSAPAGENTIKALYTKTGKLGKYGSYLGLAPDYNVGFSLLVAGEDIDNTLNVYADLISDAIDVALQEEAAKQALLAYGGQYHVQGPSSNSSITLRVDKQPGLYVDTFISNGTDALGGYAALINAKDASNLSFRLYPTNLMSARTSGSRIAFRAVLQDKGAFEDSGTATCVSWMHVDQYTYRSAPLDELIFTMDDGGRATSLEIPAFRTTLTKTS
ncbi:MAG: hypothetical protein M1828_005810 [Chrysothrix sp. TS-e1954]|nr:MAG: hypothetical protein M1828_005810 [Chrysothrix sp. TS-e1954]